MKSTTTPWGQSDNPVYKADGVTWHTTPSHGGIELSPERHAAIRKAIPRFSTFAGGHWYEEDCDAADAIRDGTFPEHVWDAKEWLKDCVRDTILGE